MPGCERARRIPRAEIADGNLSDYWWFCLEHVRAYNSTWDYYKGMTPGGDRGATARRHRLAAPVLAARPAWQRRGLGRGAAARPAARARRRRVPGAGTGGGPKQTPPELREPLATLGLSWPTTLDAVKTRYKELAKRHHPDANGGDRAAEERLKTINLAYAAVRSRLVAEPSVAAAG